MNYSILADLIVAVHVAYVGFVILGQIAIIAGTVLGWRWVRNPWFRIAHLLAICFVALEAVIGMECPLTVWEAELRSLAGLPVHEGTFIGRCLHEVIFYDLPTWVFTSMYLGFAVVVLGTFVLAPPYWRHARADY